MKPIDSASYQSHAECSNTNFSQCDDTSSETGVKCPKCGAVQGIDNEFCVYCGAKIRN